MAHVGTLYPHIERLDFRFPDAPWSVPPKLWILDGITLLGTQAGDFPPTPWIVGLTDVQVAGRFITWTTNLVLVGGFWSRVHISVGIYTPTFWLGAGVAVDRSSAVISNSISAVAMSNPIASTYFDPNIHSNFPATLRINSTGYAVPKPW